MYGKLWWVCNEGLCGLGKKYIEIYYYFIIIHMLQEHTYMIVIYDEKNR